LISILVCRLLGREEGFKRLSDILAPQLGNVAEIVHLADAGELTIGTKRNKLLDMANGEYCCFVDDDDTVAADYVSSIAEALKDSPDCAEMRGKIFWFNQWTEFRHSIRYCGWYANDGIFFRTPNHLNAIRTEICRDVRFPADKNAGEDVDFSKRVRRFLKTEGACSKNLYTYVPHLEKGPDA
jgi:glycosyltransferase involved in cell wall biosynthesis